MLKRNSELIVTSGRPVDDAARPEIGEIQVRPGPLRVNRFRSLASIKPLRLWLSLACVMGTPGPPAPLAGGNLRTDPDPNPE
jgi:hypothetical protein